MACLYIDQLKSHFPKIQPSIPRAKPNEKWCPQILLESLDSQASDDYYISDEFAVRNAAMNFLPKVPKIFAIGLRLDREDAGNASVSQCWSIDSMKTFLKQYFSIIRSYQNYFYTSWRSDPKKTTDRSSGSFVPCRSTISGCPTKPQEESLNVQETRGADDTSRDVRRSANEYRAARRPEERNREGGAIVADQTRDRKSNCTMTSAVGLSSNEKNDQRAGRAHPNGPASKSKRHVCVQTVEPSRSGPEKSAQRHEDERSGIASSKDVETIFAANSENFNRERRNADSRLLRTRRTRDGSKRRSKRKCGTEKSSRGRSDVRPNAWTSAKENIFHRTNGTDGVAGRAKRRFVVGTKEREPIGHPISSNGATSELDISTSCTSDDLTIVRRYRNDNPVSKWVMLIRNEHRDGRRILGPKLENCADPSGPRCTNQRPPYESLHGTKSDGDRLETEYTLRGSSGYTVEDKSSEMTILGNVKKRLEEDYDDYFSLKDTDLETDRFVDANDPDTSAKLEARANDSPAKRPRSVSSASLTKHKELRQQLRVRSFRTCLTRSTPPSLLILNTDLHRLERSSCHSSLKERECSPSSSIEYCTASSLSLTNLQPSSRDDSIGMLFQGCSMMLRDDRPYTLEKRPCISEVVVWEASRDGNANATIDERHSPLYDEREEEEEEEEEEEDEEDEVSSLEGDEVFLDTREPAGGCREWNWTPRFANSSKLVTESLDSGILTDCSRGGRVPADPLRPTMDVNGDEPRGCCARRTDLLPAYDFDTDSSCSDESLDRRVDVAVRKFTENLILGERRVRCKLQRRENPARHRQERKRRRKCRQVRGVSKGVPKHSSACLFETSPRFYDDDWFISSSSPPLYSFSESEMDLL